ncbi:MAG: protein phosphatase CheZ [Ectothiorhodospiraceae bacterium]|nr:protein phosphatase CheZ [Ectothiorhodospiraceae bacterium]
MTDDKKNSSEYVDDDVLEHAEDMVRALQEGNDRQATELLAYISQARETGLYNEVGKMTRQLHDSMNAFCEDTRIDELAEDEIPDARSRLKYVIEMTQKSADRSLTAVENTMPKCDALSGRISELGEAWQNFKRREMSVEQFRELSAKLETFFVDAEQDTSSIRSGLNEIMMAQDFQDLTGQIITRVIELVEEVEGNLIELVRLTGSKMTNDNEKPKEDAIKAEGPQVPGVGKDNVVSGQDEVDDLLSSLGF